VIRRRSSRAAAGGARNAETQPPQIPQPLNPNNSKMPGGFIGQKP
jgi:hypothetical protein